AAHVATSLDNRIALILDGGPCALGLESTIVAIDRDRIRLLRPGPIEPAEISRVAGKPVITLGDGPVEAPGQLASHYAPAKPLRLSVTRAEPDEFHLGYGSVAGDWSLSPEGDLVTAAARLFAGLHLAEASDRPRIAVAPIPQEGLG